MNENNFKFLYQNVDKLKGIGPKKASYLRNLGINSVIDAFYILPSRVIDRTQDIDFRKLEKGQIITTSLKVKKHHYPFNPKLPYVIECTKGNLIINLIYFSVKGNFLRNKFPENKEFIVSGKVSFYKSNISIAHPDYIEEIENEDKLRSFENIYPLTRGIHLKDLKKIFDFGKIYIEKYEEWISIQIIDKFNFRNKTANNVSIQEFEDNILKSRIDTENLIWKNNNWVAKNAMYRSFNNQRPYSSLSDTILQLDIKPIDLIESRVKPEEMDYWTLKTFIDRLKSNGREHRKWLVDLYFKTAFPFSNIIMILFGVVLTIRKPRTNFLIGIGLSIFVIFIYYIMIKAGQSAGYSGALSPILSVWIANILFFICGLISLTKTKS